VPHEPTTPRSVTPIVNGVKGAATDDLVVTESPMELRIASVPIAVVMRTPGNDSELAMGFLLTEGIIFSPGEVATIARLSDDRLEVMLSEGVVLDPEQFRRNLYTTSSCGVCGKASIDAVRITARAMADGPVVPADRLDYMADVLRSGQATFETTGGLHGVGLFDADGGLMALHEDVGRHNAVDKVVGEAARNRWPLSDTVLMVSGRVSFEIVQKAAVVGIPFVAGISAASSLAVELAGEMRMTVVGFVRPGRATIYTGAERVG
jgi:FdhD protein